VTIAATGFDGAESVAVDARGNVYGGGKDGVIRKLAADGRVTDFVSTGGRPLGMAFDGRDNLIVCDIGVERVLAVDPSGEIRTFADKAGDMRLGFPNGAVFDADGNLYISNSFDQPISEISGSATSDHDRLVRLPTEKMAAEVRDRTPTGSLSRIRADGRSEVVTRGLYCPNGVAIDPDETAVYVLQSTVNNCLRIPLAGGAPEIFAEFDSMPDGLAFDAEGDVIVTLPLLHRLVILDRHGNHAATLVDDPAHTKLDLPTNCAFGGPDFDQLYVGHVIADHIAQVPYGQKGHPLFNLRAGH
jgi:sugar lactone lactonase YvrE